MTIEENGRLFNEISEQDVVDYLNHLFENKHFLPSTVEKYRSAIYLDLLDSGIGYI